jgi:hypothetical protein
MLEVGLTSISVRQPDRLFSPLEAGSLKVRLSEHRAEGGVWIWFLISKKVRIRRFSEASRKQGDGTEKRKKIK